jgi:hypothetical protein
MTDPAFFNQAFWQQLTVTFLGVLVGLPFAVWVGIRIYRHQTRHQQQRDRLERRKLRRQVLDKGLRPR